MTPITEPRQLLALEQAATAQRDTLVQHANRAVLLLSGARGLKENQIRNVVNVAGEIGSIEGLLNFIRYQIAREKNWQSGRSSKGLDFGHQVIEDIRTAVHQAACAAADEALDHLNATADPNKRLGDTDRDALYATAYLRLAEEYLGYLNRAFVYCEKIENGGYGTLEQYVQSIRECKHGAS
jgi:hypothetical protein